MSWTAPTATASSLFPDLHTQQHYLHYPHYFHQSPSTKIKFFKKSNILGFPDQRHALVIGDESIKKNMPGPATIVDNNNIRATSGVLTSTDNRMITAVKCDVKSNANVDNHNHHQRNYNNLQQQPRQQRLGDVQNRTSPTRRDASHYEELNVIGNGAYGTVFRARDRQTDSIVALKKMRFTLTEDGVPMAILREISLLKQLEKFDHPNIVRLLDICHGQRREREMSLYLVFEHVHQDLATYLEKCPSPGLGPDRIKDIMFQILSGVDFLHSHRIVHRDLKPQNLLVTREGKVKLTDFGLARIYEFYTLLTSVVVTLWYRSPEILLGLSYATPVDMWSCGCIFAELFLRSAIFPGQYEMDQLCKIFELLGTPSEEEWPENAAVSHNNFKTSVGAKDWHQIIPEIDSLGLDLLERLLQISPLNRITANDALIHPYFSEDGFAPLSLSPPSSATSSRNSSRRLNISSSALSSGSWSLDSSLTSSSFSSHNDSSGSTGPPDTSSSVLIMSKNNTC